MGKEYLIGDFLKRIKRPLPLVADKKYKLVTIKMNHNGVILRGLKKGEEIKSKMYEVKEGDFILSGIDARNGAFGIIPKELDGAIVTNDFWYFEIDEKIISKKLFLELTATTWFDEICKKGSDGTTQRIRLQKDKFFNQKVILPSKNEQEDLLSKLLLIKTKRKDLITEIKTQKQYIKLLKQSILQEAIQGKLTAVWRKQNPDSEPASELLKRIKAEKQKLIAEKKIRKVKPLPPITKEEIPFELPDGWVWCRLREIATFNYGKSLTKSQCINGAKYPVFGSNGIVGYYNKYLTDKRTIIIGRKGSAGALNISDMPSWTTDVAYFIEENEYIEFNFLYILLKSIKLEKLGKGIKPGVNRNEVYHNVIPLPPLAEQKAIVKKVESLMQKVSAMEEEINKSEQNAEMLMQAVLKEAFEGKKEENEV